MSPPYGVLAPVSGGERPPSIPLQGEESVTTDLCPHYTYCPPETGGTSEAEGGIVIVIVIIFVFVIVIVIVIIFVFVIVIVIVIVFRSVLLVASAWLH